jgi:hypothetical protein
MANAWVEHIRQFAKARGLAYGCALSNAECRATYKSKKVLRAPETSAPHDLQKKLKALKRAWVEAPTREEKARLNAQFNKLLEKLA